MQDAALLRITRSREFINILLQKQNKNQKMLIIQ